MPKTQNITPTLGRPAPPSFIKGEALEEWKRVCDELDAMGTLTTADRPILTLYVSSWARWLEAVQHVNEDGEVIPAPRTGTPMHNPWLTILNNERKAVLKLAQEMGLTQSSRLEIARNWAKVNESDDNPPPDFEDLD